MAQEKSISDEVTKYASNVDRDIYTVSNIPEEVIAVIFAYVSRSPKGFRENIGTVIQEEQLGQERAAKFHEKWVLNYGHASVAEHASVHVGIEKVSRLFSSILELSNEYMSFTEYSQRYQSPAKGDFFTPEELDQHSSLKNKYIQLNNYQYDLYFELNGKLFEFLKDTVPTPEGIEERLHHRALEKIAFEDARYALNLATYTNLGMTANARAIEDSLTKLLSSRYPEVRKRAQEIKEEVRFSVPTLVKYANENKYITETRDIIEGLTKKIIGQSRVETSNETYEVNLLNWTGKDSPDPEAVAIDTMVKAILFEHLALGYEDIDKDLSGRSLEEKLDILKKSLEKLGKFDNPVNALKLVKYEVEFVISEACWHQLLRHRKVNWITKEPGIQSGITIPPHIEKSGTQDLLRKAVSESENLYHELLNQNLTEVASYVVTNAHNRRILGTFDLWELYHLINLRMSKGAQWDIKNITGLLAQQIGKYHPNLISPALKRVD
ncbi:MAG: FAD-dependent thymidylate synthase [Candidatus Dadabacteria bacterium]|nr:FAD-dependent thymidylate synthase [Candidatus Dadabacteria bacterium]